MPACSAPDCSRHSRNGARLFKFPASPTRRASWIENTRRDNWEPTNFSKLCEVHFDLTQYETLTDDWGKKKLRRTAVPTIFDVPRQKVAQRDVTSIDHDYAKSPTVPCSWDIQTKEQVSSILHDLPNTHKNENCDENKEFTEEMVSKRDYQIVAQRREIWRLKKKIQQLNKANKKLSSIDEYLPFFSIKQPDMCSCKVRDKLSSQLIQEARRVRAVLGYRGYKYLVDKGLPLISKSNATQKILFYRLPSPEILKTL